MILTNPDFSQDLVFPTSCRGWVSCLDYLICLPPKTIATIGRPASPDISSMRVYLKYLMNVRERTDYPL
jgi:hypothetical protein